ncbi:BrnA antitoxin family protein [Verminephrobacter eiseniae]|uniref:BrnA antitoxin family protein n=1 Tax=Verminephrobacter eiseniae TaxID=364317 RepID=UPI002238DE92|nr:BrnA antitoxin family protein [Verminephrobacter eiseniae]
MGSIEKSSSRSQRPQRCADLLETFKATGKGWQTRVNAALRQFITEHPPDH